MDCLDRLCAVARLADDEETVCLEQLAGAGEGPRVVVDDEDGGHGVIVADVCMVVGTASRTSSGHARMR